MFWEYVTQNLVLIVNPLLVFLVTLLCGYSTRRFLFQRLVQWSQHTKSQIDDIIIEAVRGPFLLWFIMLGAYFGLAISRFPGEIIVGVEKAIFILGVVSVMLVLGHISTRVIRVYSHKIQTTLPITSLTQNISRTVIFAIGILIILNSLGLSIAPLLATLGIGSLAVALALQDTLSNIFSGFYIIIARQVKIGDYIKLETGEEGYVMDITWRTTKIRMLPNNAILVPNEKLTKSIITNYYLPDKELAVLVNIGVHYQSDLVKVEHITREVAKDIMRIVPGGIPDFDPFIRYHTFGDFSINFTVILRVQEFVDQHLVKHEFIKALHSRYKKEGIVIPYPIRAMNYNQEKNFS